MIGPLYRVTDSGRTAWETQDPSIPSNYRLILWTIDFHGAHHLAHLAHQFPHELLEENLRELEELRLIEPLPVGGAEPAKRDTTIPLGTDDIAKARSALS